jgi:hypothetical protein
MVHHEHRCDSVEVATVTPGNASILPGTVVVCLESIVVDVPVLVYATPHQWGEIQEDNLFDGYAKTFNGRGPPQQIWNDTRQISPLSITTYPILTGIISTVPSFSLTSIDPCGGIAHG